MTTAERKATDGRAAADGLSPDGRQVPDGRRKLTRADVFARDLAALRIPDPAASRSQLWLRTGETLMVLGLVLEVTAYVLSHGTSDPLVQGDAITLALGGVAACVTGAALFLRHSLVGFLRFWLARQSYDLAQLGHRPFERSSDDLTGDDPSTR
jgi:hypothetical protein